MSGMGKRPPDVCLHVFTCALCDWQVQVGPRARSDIGGAIDTFREVADSHRVHIYAEHSKDERESMRTQLQRGGAPEGLTRQRGGDSSAAYLMASPLPRWWVDLS